MKKKVFISHRRDSGQASTEAIFIQNLLVKETNANVFMDVTEDYLGVFPQTLKEKIKQSDSFVLILPKSDNYKYLCDPDNWVHKEIKFALNYKDANNKPSRIVPVTFDRDFTFPPKENLGEISEIADYSFVYYDTNSKDMANRLINAFGLSKQTNSKLFWVLSVVIAFMVGMGVWSLNSEKVSNMDNLQTKKYTIEEVNTFASSMQRFCSLQEFTDSASTYLNSYLKWYLGELDKGKDTKTNTEFNDAYVKEYCLRLIVLTYLTYSNGDLEQSFENNEIDLYVEKCYKNIPEENRYPISLKQKDRKERDKEMEIIVDNSVEILNKDARLSSIDKTMLPIVKSTILSSLWPSGL